MINDKTAGSQQGPRNDIVVIGIGQALRGDDGAGLEAVRFWQEKFPQTAASVRVELVEASGLELLDLLKGMRAAIMVDALKASSPSGGIVRLRLEDLASFLQPERSAHGWGLAETLQLGLALHPGLGQVRMTLLGIVGNEFSLGAGISPRVWGVMGTVADRMETEVQLVLSNNMEKETIRP